MEISLFEKIEIETGRKPVKIKGYNFWWNSGKEIFNRTEGALKILVSFWQDGKALLEQTQCEAHAPLETKRGQDKQDKASEATRQMNLQTAENETLTRINLQKGDVNVQNEFADIVRQKVIRYWRNCWRISVTARIRYLGKAMKRTAPSLPQSPSKRRVVVSGLANYVGLQLERKQ